MNDALRDTGRGDRHRLAATFAFALIVGSPALARAQGVAGDADRAEKLFAEASALVQAGDFASACPKFEESQRLDPAVGTEYNLALCLSKTGRLGSAYHHLLAVERDARRGGRSARAEAATRTLAELRPHVPHLVLTSRDAEATVSVDGTAVPRADFHFWAVDPGDHVIEATAPTKKTWRLHVSMPVTVPQRDPGTAGFEQHVDVPDLALAPGEVIKIDTSNPRRTWGWVVGAVGVAGVGAAVVTSILVIKAKSIADDRCQLNCLDQDGNVDQRGEDAVSRGKTLIPINYVAWAVGVAGLGVGSFLLLTSGKKAAPAAQVGASVDGGGGSLRVVGTF